MNPLIASDEYYFHSALVRMLNHVQKDAECWYCESMATFLRQDVRVPINDWLTCLAASAVLTSNTHAEEKLAIHSLSLRSQIIGPAVEIAMHIACICKYTLY